MKNEGTEEGNNGLQKFPNSFYSLPPSLSYFFPPSTHLQQGGHFEWQASRNCAFETMVGSFMRSKLRVMRCD
uniref:Uncharacterized protein n=1 Tax=Anguilla anguilla TaxID=7936 RepID=A0A0E9XCR7_ANGAN